MVRLDFEHCGAIQMLLNQGVKLTYEDEGPYQGLSVFPAVTPNLFLVPPKTQIECLPESMKTPQIRNIDYAELLNMGFMIVARLPERKLYPKQKYEFILFPYDADIPNYESIPPDHWVEYDIVNRAIRLMGRTAGVSAISRWISIRQSRETSTDASEDPLYSMMLEAQQIKRDMDPAMPDFVDADILDIPEMPILMTDANELVCIEDVADAPVIGLVGMRGCGKSTLLNSICSRAYWKWNKRCFVMNDKMREAYAWALKWERMSSTAEFFDMLNYLHEDTIGLPSVHLHPQTNPPIQSEHMIYPNDVGVKISLPFKKFILDYENVLKGKKDWEFKKTGPWFRMLLYDPETNKPINDLLECKSPKDFEQLIKERFPKGNRSVMDKIYAVLSDLYNQNILNTSSGVPSYWRITRYVGEEKIFEGVYSPWMACLAAGVVPFLETFTLMDGTTPKSYFPQYQKFVIEDEMKTQKEDKYFVSNKIQIWNFIDELEGISSKKKPTVATDTLQALATEGRPLRIGTVYATQHYGQLLDKIAGNTNHLFIVRQKGKDLKAIQRDFPSIEGKSMGNQIQKLKNRECVAVTNTRFIVYNEAGDREIVTDVPMKGRIIPPLNQHPAPMKM